MCLSAEHFLFLKFQVTVVAMNLAAVAALSLAETVAVVRRDEILAPTSLGILLALVVAQYVVVKLYDIFVWPFYVSPLRHLPTPKVQSSLQYCGPLLT